MTRTLALALAVPLLVSTALAQQATFKAGVDLVSVDVLVTARGEPIGGLAASDFELRDNNVLQKIDSISAEGTAGVTLSRVPLDVVLVFDTSESMSGTKIQQLVDAGKAVLAKLRPGDRTALVTFSERTTIRQALSSDVATVTRALDRLYASGRTSMSDALYTGLSLRRTSDTRSMLLLFSDGQDTSSWLGSKQIAQVARESDVVVYAVGLDKAIKDDMQEITEQTGGAVIVAQSPRDLKALFERIVGEMQARYVLKYYPSGVAQGGWHTLEVRLPGRRGAEVVARRGYWRQ
jgi:VWFA-related protein